MFRKFFTFLFGAFTLWAIYMTFSTGSWGFVVSIIIGVVAMVAIWTDNLDLIPGDTATEVYRLRMMYKEQNRNRRQR